MQRRFQFILLQIRMDFDGEKTLKVLSMNKNKLKDEYGQVLLHDMGIASEAIKKKNSKWKNGFFTSKLKFESNEG